MLGQLVHLATRKHYQKFDLAGTTKINKVIGRNRMCIDPIVWDFGQLAPWLIDGWHHVCIGIVVLI